MARIQRDYRVKVTNPDGTVIEDITLFDYDLERPVARASVIEDIKEAIDKAEAK